MHVVFFIVFFGIMNDHVKYSEEFFAAYDDVHGSILGSGSFGNVITVRNRKTGDVYASKIFTIQTKVGECNMYMLEATPVTLISVPFAPPSAEVTTRPSIPINSAATSVIPSGNSTLNVEEAGFGDT